MWMTDRDTLLESLDEQVLTTVVRQVLNNTAIEILEWKVVSIHGQYNPVTGGVYRVTGSAAQFEREVPWSVVLKIVQGSSRIPTISSEWLNDPKHLAYWQREPLLFQSDVL